MCEIEILTPNDGLPSENEILERIYNFILTNFNKFGHKKINYTYWFKPSWTPFITYCFYKWGNELGFTLGLKREQDKFRKFYKKMEGVAAEKAVYGEGLLIKLSKALSDEFGKGFSYANLRNFRQFYLTYPDSKNCYALRSNLNWTHHRIIMRMDNILCINNP